MAKYGLSTDQVEQWRQSAHGIALLQSQNFAAPTCLGCHGSHSALPPTVTEVANVCSRCHQLVGDAFQRGPHGQAAREGKLAGCLGCHSNHGTERFPPDRIAATCTKCHATGSRAHSFGTEIQQLAIQAEADLQAATTAIEQVGRTGQRTDDARFRSQTARTAYLQVAEAQHDLDLDGLEELTRRVRSISRDLRGMAEVTGERQWERKLFLLPVWFLALSALYLAWLVLRRLERRDAGESR